MRQRKSFTTLILCTVSLLTSQLAGAGIADSLPSNNICATNGGVVKVDGSTLYCVFPATTSNPNCASRPGWTQYQNYYVTSAKLCTGTTAGCTGKTTCKTRGSTGIADNLTTISVSQIPSTLRNNAPDTCTHCSNGNSNTTCTAAIVAYGCTHASLTSAKTSNNVATSSASDAAYVSSCNSTNSGQIQDSIIAPNGKKICKMTVSSCPTGWSKFRNWTTTQNRRCTSSAVCASANDGGWACNSGSHTFADNATVESCRYGVGCSSTCTASVTQVGCYK